MTLITPAITSIESQCTQRYDFNCEEDIEVLNKTF